MIEGTRPAEDWLREAKARYGQALQRMHIAQTKMKEVNQTATQRQAAGNPLNAQEQESYRNKITQCKKAISESQSFMEKFKEQQGQFRQQAQHRYSNPAAPGASEVTEQTAAVAPNMPAGVGPQGPTAHSISSAVSAARNQASAAQNVGSPTATAATTAMQHPTPTTQQNPMAAAQSPYHTQQSMTDAQRPVSHQGSMIPPQALQQPSAHSHPLNQMPAGMKRENQPSIAKTLQVTEPKPVPMPPSRPTLNGGAGVGLPGQIAQPAITSMPGYVLETSEDGHLLGKKKLNELVREVCGPGREEQLTPEAEEVNSLHSLPTENILIPELVDLPSSRRRLRRRPCDSSLPPRQAAWLLRPRGPRRSSHPRTRLQHPRAGLLDRRVPGR